MENRNKKCKIVKNTVDMRNDNKIIAKIFMLFSYMKDDSYDYRYILSNASAASDLCPLLHRMLMAKL